MSTNKSSNWFNKNLKKFEKWWNSTKEIEFIPGERFSYIREVRQPLVDLFRLIRNMAGVSGMILASYLMYNNFVNGDDRLHPEPKKVIEAENKIEETREQLKDFLRLDAQASQSNQNNK